MDVLVFSFTFLTLNQTYFLGNYYKPPTNIFLKLKHPFLFGAQHVIDDILIPPKVSKFRYKSPDLDTWHLNLDIHI